MFIERSMNRPKHQAALKSYVYVYHRLDGAVSFQGRLGGQECGTSSRLMNRASRPFLLNRFDLSILLWEESEGFSLNKLYSIYTVELQGYSGRKRPSSLSNLNLFPNLVQLQCDKTS